MIEANTTARHRDAYRAAHSARAAAFGRLTRRLFNPGADKPPRDGRD